MSGLTRKVIFFAFAFLLLQPHAASAQTDQEKFQKSVELFTQENYLQSGLILKELLKDDPQNSLYWFNIGNCFFKLKKYRLAVRSYNEVIKLNKKFVGMALLYKSKVYSGLGRARDALQVLQTSENLNVSSAQAKLIASEIEQIVKVLESEQQALRFFQQQKTTAAYDILNNLPPEFISNDASVLTALVLLKLEQKTLAEKKLIQIYRTKSLSAEQKKLITELLQKPKDRGADGDSLALSLDLAVGHNSNVYLEGPSAEPIASLITRIGSELSYQLSRTHNSLSKLQYNLSYERPESAPELSVLSQTASFVYERQNQNLSWRTRPYLQFQIWGGQSAFYKSAVQADAKYINGNNDFGVTFDFGLKNSLDPSLAYLRGTEYLVRPYWVSQLSREASLQIYIQYGADQISDIVYADASLLPLAQNYYGVGTKINWQNSERSFLTFAAGWTTRDFKTLSEPTDKKRLDQELSAGLSYKYYFLPNWSVYATLDYIKNSSSLGVTDVRDKNYQTNLFMLGLTWDAFE